MTDYGFIVLINDHNKDLSYKDSHLIKVVRGLSLPEALTYFINRFKELFIKNEVLSVGEYSSGFCIMMENEVEYDILVIQIDGNSTNDDWIGNYEFVNLSQYYDQIYQLIMESHVYWCSMFKENSDEIKFATPVYKSHKKMETSELIGKTYSVDIHDVTILELHNDTCGNISFIAFIKAFDGSLDRVFGSYREIIKDSICYC